MTDKELNRLLEFTFRIERALVDKYMQDPETYAEPLMFELRAQLAGLYYIGQTEKETD